MSIADHQPGPFPERLYLWLRRHPRRAELLFALALGTLLLPGSVVMIVPTTQLVWWIVLLTSLIVVHLAPLLRRTRPLLSFSLVSAALAGQTLAPLSSYRSASAFLPSALVFLVSLYSLCLYGQPWTRGAGLVVGVVGSIMITVRTVLILPDHAADLPGGDAAWAFLIGALLMAVFTCWGFARLRQVRLNYLALLEERANRAEAEREERTREAIRLERARIARDIHDVVAHALAVIVTQAQGGAAIAAKAPELAVGALDTIAISARQALSDMRRMLGVLRTQPAVEIDPRPTLADLDRLLAEIRATGLPVRRVDLGTRREIGATLELTVYRIVQEALTNTLRHAGPGAAVELGLTWSADELTVTVADNGRGPADPAGSQGNGLIGMRERVAVLGGELTAGPALAAVTGRVPARAGGFLVRAVIPIGDRGPAKAELS